MLAYLQYTAHNIIHYAKVGGSQKKFRKSQIRKFVRFEDLPQMWHLRIFRKCDTLQICDLWTQLFFYLRDLKLLQIRKYILYLIANIAYKA